MESNSFRAGPLFSRRSLLLSAGGVAAGLASGVGRASALTPTLGQLTSSEDVAAATAAAVSYLGARASATTGMDFANVSKWINPDNRGLTDFENNHFSRLSDLGKPSYWNGIIDRIWSEATVLDCFTSTNEVRLTIQDWMGVQWRPAPVVVHRTPEQEAFVRQFPDKYGLNDPDYPLTISGFGTRHDLTMVRTSRGWLVERDSYSEPIVSLGGTSPDYVEQVNLASSRDAARSTGSLRSAKPLESDRSLLGLTFDWTAAYQYAKQWGGTLRNPSYSDFSNLGGDCANFVSQCFRAGGYPTDGNWYQYSYDWKNNIGLRAWLLASGRGIPSNLGAMGYADIINFDWHSDGIFDHVAIVTDPSGPRISSHTIDVNNVPYTQIMYSDTSLEFATTLVYY